MTKSTNERYRFETTLNLRQRKIIIIYIYNTYDEDSTLWNISLEYYARYRIDILVQPVQDASQRLGLDHHQDRRADGHRPPPHAEAARHHRGDARVPVAATIRIGMLPKGRDTKDN